MSTYLYSAYSIIYQTLKMQRILKQQLRTLEKDFEDLLKDEIRPLKCFYFLLNHQSPVNESLIQTELKW